MAVQSNVGKKRRWLVRNLAAGIAGLVAAAILMLVTLWMQDYSSPTFLLISLFIFPVPVACGLCVGLVSPRRAIVWAPLWASIFTLLLFMLLTGSIHGISAAFSRLQFALTVTGTVLAAAAGLAGQYASNRGLALKAVVVFLLLCCIMAFVEYKQIVDQMYVFESEVKPLILSELNKDYIQIPARINYKIERRPTLNGYELSTVYKGKRLSILAGTDCSRIIGVNYEYDRVNKKIVSNPDAVKYLTELGFQKKLLSSLSRQKGRQTSWCASLERTRLLLTNDGCVTLQVLPDIDAKLR